MQEIEIIKKNVISYDYNGDIAGILHKYSPSWLKGWQRRVIVLHNRKLKWFTVKKSTKISLSLPDCTPCNKVGGKEPSSCFETESSISIKSTTAGMIRHL